GAAEVRAAAAAARLDEVVERLPDGWATGVGEGGALLSGGERQRVSIARALLKDAPVVLLDEVTSALDPVNEAAVHAGIEHLMAGRTVVMVAHRLRTVRSADRIAFLDGGRIVEQGTHDELLRRGGRYAGFWHASSAPAASGCALARRREGERPAALRREGGRSPARGRPELGRGGGPVPPVPARRGSGRDFSLRR